MKLSDIEADTHLDVPVESGRAIKALAAGTANAAQQAEAYRFIVERLAGTDRLSFVVIADLPMDLIMAWREGRRFVGMQLRRIVAAPAPPDPGKPEPKPRATAARVRRLQNAR